MANRLKDKIKDAWNSLSRKSDEDGISGIGREKIIVFLIALVLACCLWLVVNFNREYTIDVKVPIVLGNITTDQALVEELPSEVTASVSGDGWSLINIYQTPPQIYIDVSEQEVNLLEQVRQQISSSSAVTVQIVEPLYLQLNLEKKSSKKVPVISNVNVSYANQYGFLTAPEFVPDSITVRGAASIIQNVDSWPTEARNITDVKKSLSTNIALKEPTSLIALSQKKVQYRVDVAQYTEAEVTVPVETRDFPVGFGVTFSPSSVNIIYRIPLEEYSIFKNRRSFTAFVNYSQLQQDTTGFVAPQIEKLQDEAHLNVQRMDPSKVAYFTIIGN